MGGGKIPGISDESSNGSWILRDNFCHVFYHRRGLKAIFKAREPSIRAVVSTAHAMDMWLSLFFKDGPRRRKECPPFLRPPPPPFFPIWSLSAVWACFPGFKLIFNRYPRSGAFFHRWTSYTYPLAPRSGINSAGAWGVRRRERRLRSMGWISCLRCWFLQSRPVGPRIEKGRGGGGARRVLGFYMSITN